MSSKYDLINAVIEHHQDGNLSKYVVIGNRSHDVVAAQKLETLQSDFSMAMEAKRRSEIHNSAT
jgi:hypothetical protein